MKKLLLLWGLLLSYSSLAIEVDKVIPVKAFKYIPVVYDEQSRLMPEHPQPYYFPSLIEQESCIYLLHSRCWDPSSRLKTSREEGAGLGQITRAYNKDGTIRFDSLKSLYNSFREELDGLTWETVYSRPDLQIRSIVLLYREDYSVLRTYARDPYEAVKFADAAYNSGRRRIITDIIQCKLQKDCDPTVWFNNVEKTCSFSKKKLYGKKSPCEINREHVYNTTKVRIGKYKKDYVLRTQCGVNDAE